MEGVLFVMLLGTVFAVAVALAKASARSDTLRRQIEDLERAAAREAHAARTAFWYLEQRVQTLERRLREIEAARAQPLLPEPPLPATEPPLLSAEKTDSTPPPSPRVHESQKRETEFAWPTLEATSEVRARNPFTDSKPDEAEGTAEPEIAPEPAAPVATAPPARAPDPVEPSRAAEPEPPRVSWEQWIGVRGAAALGGIVSVVAGLYFFKYGIEHGLITPELRVMVGFAVGVALVAGADGVVRPRHRVLGSWLAGAGIAILYTTTWAATTLYGFLGTGVGFFVMCAVTALCCALATLRGSLPIAGLGLIGGFATPALLSTGDDRPVALFSYLFILDAALLWVARRRDWASLALFSLIGTVGYEASWIVARMQPERVALGLAVLAVFGVLFSVVTGSDADERPVWAVLRVAGLCVPLAFGFGLALERELEQSSVVLFGPFAVAIVIGASWAAQRDRVRWLGPFAVVGAVLTLAAWALSRPALAPMEWPWVAGVLVIAAVPLLPRVLPRGASRIDLWCALLALLALCVVAAGCTAAAWPFETGVLVAAALAFGTATTREDSRIVVVAAALGTIALLVVREARAETSQRVPFESILLGIALAVGVFDRVAARRRSVPGSAAAAFGVALGVLVHWLWTEPQAFGATWTAAALLGAVFLACAAASRLGGAHLGAASIGASVVLLATLSRAAVPLDGGRAEAHVAASLGLACAASTALLVLAWTIGSRRLREDAVAWRAATAAPLIVFPVVLGSYRALFGRTTQGIAAVVPALCCMGALVVVQRFAFRDHAVRRTATIWAAACTTALATAAVPLQLDREWITIGWALESVALLLLWRRFDHAGLEYWAIGLLTAVTVRLVANPAVTTYHRASALPLVNWISYTYLIPAACSIAGWWLLRDLEVERRRSWERGMLSEQTPLLSRACAASAVLVAFAWLNLSVVSWYAPEHRLVFSLQNVWARDLTMSIAWAAYALVLLGIGMWRGSTALRFTSLVLILGTSGKVFLYDLSHLDDLYRVASLVGLALSLVAISVAYQRLVFRRGLR